MFNPIYAFTGDQLPHLILGLWLGTTLLILLQWAGRNSVKFVQDEEFVPVLGNMFDRDQNFQWMFVTFFTMLGWVIWGVLVFAINWLWFPLTIIAVIIGMLYMMRGVVRLKKGLEAHKSDRNAHQ